MDPSAAPFQPQYVQEQDQVHFEDSWSLSSRFNPPKAQQYYPPLLHDLEELAAAHQATYLDQLSTRHPDPHSSWTNATIAEWTKNITTGYPHHEPVHQPSQSERNRSSSNNNNNNKSSSPNQPRPAPSQSPPRIQSRRTSRTPTISPGNRKTQSSPKESGLIGSRSSRRTGQSRSPDFVFASEDFPPLEGSQYSKVITRPMKEAQGDGDGGARLNVLRVSGGRKDSWSSCGDRGDKVDAG